MTIVKETRIIITSAVVFSTMIIATMFLVHRNIENTVAVYNPKENLADRSMVMAMPVQNPK